MLLLKVEVAFSKSELRQLEVTLAEWPSAHAFGSLTSLLLSPEIFGERYEHASGTEL